MIKYGLISETDARTIEKTIDLVCNGYEQGEVIRTTCIGIFDGDTDRGIHEYTLAKGFNHIHTAIDNAKFFEIKNPFSECNLIIGNSIEVAYLIPNNSQDFIFVDGCHAFPYVISDFFCFADKVKVVAYMAFHDTGSHIKPFTGYQDVGSKEDANMYISVRKALEMVGLFSEYLPYAFSTEYPIPEFFKWELIFDEADISNEMGGICVFKKLY